MRRASIVRTTLALLGIAWTATSARSESLTLAEAVRRASGDAAPVRIAQSRVELQRGEVAEARSALLPSLTWAASQSERTFNLTTFGIPLPGSDLGSLIGPVPTFDARLRVVQPIADLSDWRRIGSERAGADASRADARTSAQDAAANAALRYVAAERAAATVAARRSDLDIATTLDSLARVQLRSGTAANIDVLRARTQRVAARGELSLAENALERARIDLTRALGAAPDARIDLTDSLGTRVASDAPESSADALRLALERRSDLEAGRYWRSREERERNAIAAERLPRLDAAADYGASGLHLADAIPTRQVAIQLTWPLFDGARREARMQEQSARVQESEVKQHDLEQQVSAEVYVALLDVASGREQETIADERVELALQQLAEARTRFQNGVVSNIEVIDAQSSLVRARDATIAARAATAIASIHLAHATGVANTVR